MVQPSQIPINQILHANLTNGEKPPKAKQYTPAEWEEQRDRFTELYRSGEFKLNLEQIRTIMKEKYGFDATARQYKRKIKTWQLEKNTNPEQRYFMVFKSAERLEKEGRDTTFLINGYKFEEHRLDQAKKKLLSSNVQNHGILVTPNNVVYFTPDTRSQNIQSRASPFAETQYYTLCYLCQESQQGSTEATALRNFGAHVFEQHTDWGMLVYFGLVAHKRAARFWWPGCIFPKELCNDHSVVLQIPQAIDASTSSAWDRVVYGCTNRDVANPIALGGLCSELPQIPVATIQVAVNNVALTGPVSALAKANFESGEIANSINYHHPQPASVSSSKMAVYGGLPELQSGLDTEPSSFDTHMNSSSSEDMVWYSRDLSTAGSWGTQGGDDFPFDAPVLVGEQFKLPVGTIPDLGVELDHWDDIPDGEDELFME